MAVLARRRLFANSRHRATSLFVIRAERKNALVRFFGHIKLAIVFSKVAAQKHQFRRERELRQGVIDDECRTVQNSVVMVDFRHKFKRALRVTRRKANRRTAFVCGVPQIRILVQEFRVPKSNLVNGRSTCACHLRQFNGNRQVPRKERLAAVQVKADARIRVTRHEAPNQEFSAVTHRLRHGVHME